MYSPSTLFVWGKETLKQKPCQEPVREKIQAYQLADVPAAPAIVPGTDFFAGEKDSGQVFPGKNERGVNASPQKKRKGAKKPEGGRKKADTPVDGKHPQGCLPFQGELSSFERNQCSVHNFHAPARDTAF